MFLDRFWLLSMCKGELTTITTQLISSASEVGGSDRKELKRYPLSPKSSRLSLLCCESQQMFVKENPDRKKILTENKAKLTLYILKYLLVKTNADIKQNTSHIITMSNV